MFNMSNSLSKRVLNSRHLIDIHIVDYMLPYRLETHTATISTFVQWAAEQQKSIVMERSSSVSHDSARPHQIHRLYVFDCHCCPLYDPSPLIIWPCLILMIGFVFPITSYFKLKHDFAHSKHKSESASQLRPRDSDEP